MGGTGSSGRRTAVAVLLSLAAVALLLAPLDYLPDPEAFVFVGVSVELLAHVLLSGGVTVLWGWARPRLPLVALAGLAVAGAAGTELLQALPFVARSAEAEDFAFNLVGIALGLALLVLGRGLLTRAVPQAG